ncbi:metal ABC transporter ATP-binding protein [Aestuariivirga sp.]|uniref:metal ABC transporter ATP-binding protein n=1 Tax=Aestuariivirga sp. TaxID=2650926 RepID=UPI0039E6B84E
MNSVEFDKADLAAGGHTILSGVSLAIGPQEFIGLLGPNGAGKTTLLRAIMGLARVSAGTLRVLGSPPARGNPLIGYMPQMRSDAGALRLNGRDFVAAVVNGHRYGLPVMTRAARREVDRVLDLVNGSGFAARPVLELSGGERQRLLLAQALVGNPKLLLLDEPLISLDPSRQQAVVALVKDLQLQLGIPVIFSSHELNPLLGAIDRVLYLGSSQAAIGTVDAVITGPVLSKLYGTPIEVVRTGGRIFVLSGFNEAERDAHRHEHSHA